MRRWLRTSGFPLLVLAALAVSTYLAASARVPAPVPDFALQAAAVYRLEVGAACFAVLYLAAMAFVLALAGRGFAEVGTKGLRATEVVQSPELEERLERVESTLEAAAGSLNGQEQRLARLETRS